MGIPVVTVLPNGARAEVDSDVLGIARRLQEGDPSLDWQGEPSLALCWDHDHKRFEVWHTDATGKAYRVTHHPTCDADLIRKVVLADHQTSDPWNRVMEANLAQEREKQSEWDDWVENHIAPKTRWALRKDDGWDTKGQFTSMGTSA